MPTSTANTQTPAMNPMSLTLNPPAAGVEVGDSVSSPRSFVDSVIVLLVGKFCSVVVVYGSSVGCVGSTVASSEEKISARIMT